MFNEYIIKRTLSESKYLIINEFLIINDIAANDKEIEEYIKESIEKSKDAGLKVDVIFLGGKEFFVFDVSVLKSVILQDDCLDVVLKISDLLSEKPQYYKSILSKLKEFNKEDILNALRENEGVIWKSSGQNYNKLYRFTK